MRVLSAAGEETEEEEEEEGEEAKRARKRSQHSAAVFSESQEGKAVRQRGHACKIRKRKGRIEPEKDSGINHGYKARHRMEKRGARQNEKQREREKT